MINHPITSSIYEPNQASCKRKNEFIMTQDNSDEAQRENVSRDGFAPIEFTKLSQTTALPKSPRMASFGDGIHDMWLIEDLYCDALSFHDDLLTENEDGERSHPLENTHTILSWALAKMSESPNARIMLIEAEKQGWSLAMDTLGGDDYHIDVPEKLIVLDDQGLMPAALGRSEYFKNAMLVSVIRALRDVWQEKRLGAFEDHYTVQSTLMLERLRSADIDIIGVLTAWELRTKGHSSLWRHLLGGEDGDIAMRFAAILERDPSALYNGKALLGAFTQWFRDENRVDLCDHETLDYLDMVLAEHENTAIQPFGNQNIRAFDIERLSCLPDKTAYLLGFGAEILADPLYAGLNTALNQAHFMQICNDLKTTLVQHVPFRDASLAARIFPNGEFTREE